MEKFKRGKMYGLRILSIFVLALAFCLPVSAGVQEGEDEYEIYPTPQQITYGSGEIQLTDEVKLAIGDSIDTYTEARIENALSVLGITGSTTASSSSVSLTVGVYGTGDAADVYGQAHGAEEAFFENYDAYILYAEGNQIVILGQDTDAAYYGVETLETIFEQITDMTMRELQVDDYADIEFRGTIEGYYGTPWSTEDRVEMMKFGGEIKMNQYVYAPKNDPYHNDTWRELYPTEEDEDGMDIYDIQALAEAGNESKCYFVYALHPFMSNAIDFSTDASYEEDLNYIKAKFTQVMEVGVRQFAILADDAGSASNANLIMLMNDLVEWLEEMQATYPDLRTDMLFCPSNYYYTTSTQLQTLSSGFDERVHLLMTGGAIWGKVTTSFLSSFASSNGRNAYMWVNWPCSDNYKSGLIMGGHNTILEAGLDASLCEGIILNAMQQSEPSKVAIFTAMDYSWKIWQDEAEGDQAWEDSFDYIDHLTAEETDTSNALKEVAKHMIYQGSTQTSGRQAKFEESVDLAPILEDFEEKLEAGTLTQDDIDSVREEFQIIYDAADLYLTSGTNELFVEQAELFLLCLKEEAEANIYLMDALEAIEAGDNSALWDGFSQASAAYEASQNHNFEYYAGTYVDATAGLLYIVPFTETVMEYVSDIVQGVVDPEHSWTAYTANSVIRSSTWTVYSGSDDDVIDGNDSSYVWYNPGNSDTSLEGEYIGVDLGEVKRVGRVRVLVGSSGSGDKWTSYHLEYSTDNETWTAMDSYTGSTSDMDTYDVTFDEISARYIRLVNDADVAKWVKFSEFTVYAPMANASNTSTVVYTNADNGDWEVESGEDESSLGAKSGVTLASGEYIGLKLTRIRDVTDVSVSGTGLGSLTLQKSMNAVEWQDADEDGAARYIRLINNTASSVTFDLTSLVVTSDEIYAMDLYETTIGGSANTSDPRYLGTTTYWMDGDLTTSAKYCSTPSAGDYVTYDLGQEISLNSVKVYVLDGAIDYPRDAEIQYSLDGVNWTTVITIGDGISNSQSDMSTEPVSMECTTEDGKWQHDTDEPAYAYVENADIGGANARYIRLYITASYSYRWVELNEIQINGGEYIPSVNDPTYETNASLQKGYEPQNLNDLDLTSYFKTDTTDSSLIYHLSENTSIQKINIIQSASNISNAVVYVRTSDKDGWIKVGTLDSSMTSLYTFMYTNVLDIKLEWGDTAPTIYEIITLQGNDDTTYKNEYLVLLAAEQTENTTALAEAEAAVNAAQTVVNTAQAAVDAAQAQLAAASDEAAKLAAEAALAAAEAALNAAQTELANCQVVYAQLQQKGLELEIAEMTVDGEDTTDKETELEAKESEVANYETLAQQYEEAQSALDSAAQSAQTALEAYNAGASSNPTTAEQQTEQQTAQTEQQSTVTSFTYKNVTYKVLSASAKTVSAVGVKTKKVKSVTIYNTISYGGTTWKVTQIGANAFKGCKKLTKVTIGSNVKTIGKQAFANCTKLKTVNMKKAKSITSIGKKAFSKINAKARITVPAKKLAKYKKLLKKAGVPKTATIK